MLWGTTTVRRRGRRARGGRRARTTRRARSSISTVGPGDVPPGLGSAGSRDQWPCTTSSRSRRSARPRLTRDATVPTGMPSSSAVSSTLSPSQWRRTIGSRRSSGSWPSSATIAACDGHGSSGQVEGSGRLLEADGAAAAANLVDRPVDRDPVQPGAERPAAVETVEAVERLEEGLLGHVLGSRARAGHGVGRTEGVRPVPAEQALDRRGVTAAGSGDQVSLCLVDGHHLFYESRAGFRSATMKIRCGSWPARRRARDSHGARGEGRHRIDHAFPSPSLAPRLRALPVGARPAGGRASVRPLAAVLDLDDP